MSDFVPFDPTPWLRGAVETRSKTVEGDLFDPETGEVIENAKENGPKEAICSTVGDFPTFHLQCAEGVASFKRHPVPFFMDPNAWQVLVLDAERALQLYARDAWDAGWQIHELFGCDPKPWLRSYDCLGLVILLDGRTVCDIDSAGATIRNRIGASNRYRRSFDRSRAALLWDAFSPANMPA